MSEAGERPWFRIAGSHGDELAGRVRERIAQRTARGVLSPEEIRRVSSTPLLTFDGDSTASEAFRRCCIAWEVDRATPLTSHRPLVGALLVAVKKILGRILRFQNEAFLARQREFNRNLLLVMRELLDRTDRHRNRPS